MSGSVRLFLYAACTFPHLALLSGDCLGVKKKKQSHTCMCTHARTQHALERELRQLEHKNSITCMQTRETRCSSNHREGGRKPVKVYSPSTPPTHTHHTTGRRLPSPCCLPMDPSLPLGQGSSSKGVALYRYMATANWGLER